MFFRLSKPLVSGCLQFNRSSMHGQNNQNFVSEFLQDPSQGPVPRKNSETFRVHKAIFNSSVSKNGEVYAPETSCMKETFVRIQYMWIKQLCFKSQNARLWYGFTGPKRFRGFRESGPRAQLNPVRWRRISCETAQCNVHLLYYMKPAHLD